MATQSHRPQAHGEIPVITHGMKADIALRQFMVLRHLGQLPPEFLTQELAQAVPRMEVIGGSEVSDAFYNRAYETLMAIPEAYRLMVARGGYRIVLCRFMTEGFPELKGQAPRGWSAGATWDNCDAMCYGKKMAFSEYHIDYYKQEERRNKTISGDLRHEFGHAMDFCYPRLKNGIKRFSHTSAYVNAYYQDLEAMEEEARGALSYFIQGADLDSERSAGREETFAELFALTLGTGAFHNPELIRHSFRQTDALIRDQYKLEAILEAHASQDERELEKIA